MAQKWLDLAELCEHDGMNEALRMRAIQAAIGQELRSRYELPRALPPHLLVLLAQIDVGPDHEEG
jgi:hypothetical protein